MDDDGIGSRVERAEPDDPFAARDADTGHAAAGSSLGTDAVGAEVQELRVGGDEAEGLRAGHQVGGPDDLVAAMAWQQNPTRWCSTGNIVAALMIAQPERVQLLRYMAAMDPQGMGMVTSAGAVMM